MDFELSTDQKMIQQMVREFAQKEVEPIAAEIDEKGEFPMEIVKMMGPLGLMGVAIPEEYGGAGMDSVCVAIVVEELSRVCASTGVIVAVHNSLIGYGLYRFGTEEQKKEFLIPVAKGERIGAFALTEPNAGTDASAVETTAVLDGDSYVLNGTKHFITNGGVAGVYIVFASVDRSAGTKGITAFIVDRETTGFSVGKHENLMGIRGTANCELVFEDCRIPASNRLGEEGQGFAIAMHLLDTSRIGIGAQAVGIAQGALDQAITYSKQREQFGRPICKFQFIQDMLADMATQVEAARLLVYSAAWKKDSGATYFGKEASIAKWFSSRVAVDVARKAVQIHGGYGYTKEYAVERAYRDAKITEIYEGTSEVQKLVISRALTK